MADDSDRLDRDRQEADRRYNEALTALDAALVRSGAWPATAGSPSAATPDLAGLADITSPAPTPPSRWRRGHWLALVWQWLAPVFARQGEVNARLAAGLQAVDARAETSRTALRQTLAELEARFRHLERFQSALVVYAQQITAFVETKDRQIAAAAHARQDGALAGIADLQQHVALLHRTTQMLRRPGARSAGTPPEAGSPADPAPAPASPTGGPGGHDFKYVGFEDRYRGSDEDVRAKLHGYLPLFAGASDVLDIGCGRGEFVALLGAAGVSARGIDLNQEMVQVARDRGLDVVQADALAYLSSVPDESLGGLIGTQVVEHLQPDYLMRVLDMAFEKLRPGSVIVLETINPACWMAFFSSYIRDLTHVRPVHADTLRFLLEASGFVRVTIQYSAPVPDRDKLEVLNLPAALFEAADPMSRSIVDASRAINNNALRLNHLLFSYFDYAAIGYRA